MARWLFSICMLLTLAAAACHRRTEAFPAMPGKLTAVAAAIALLALDRDRLPDSLRDLLLTTNGFGGAGSAGYIKPEGVVDSWGQQLRLTTRSNWFEIRSAGPDGVFDTRDDIVKTSSQ